MNKIVLILILFLAVIVVIGFMIFSGKSQKPTITPPPVIKMEDSPKPSPIIPAATITPGTTTSKQVLEIKGNPIDKTDYGEGSSALSYPSQTNPKVKDLIIINNNDDRVISTVQIVAGYETKTIDNYIQELGQPDLKLYGGHRGFFYNVFLTTGQVIVAHQNDGVIIEKITFQPTSKELFLSTTAKQLGLSEKLVETLQ